MTEDMKMIESLSCERLQELLQSMGYRVTVAEHEGTRQLLSATQGIGFSVRPGNPAKAQGEFIDYTLSCALRVQGEIPVGLVESWNTGKRFARLTQQASFLVLETDVVLAGGVSLNYLRATVELWDRLLQELVLFLKDYVASRSGSAAAPPAATSASVAAETTAQPPQGDTGQVAELVENPGVADQADQGREATPW